jgi:alpha-L-rhamnosidase
MNFEAVRRLLCIFMLIKLSFLHAQETNQDLIHNSWKAFWISAQNASINGYGVYIFRKNIGLTEKPNKFLIHISADNRYKLYINEQFVSIGPARGDIPHYNWETIDPTPYLKAGENLVSAQVWNEAEFRPEAQISLRTGFIMQGAGAGEQIINTNKSWKAVCDSSYKPLKVEFPGQT